MTETWMERYIQIISDNYNVPDVFIQASAYHLVSSLLGRFVGCLKIPTLTQQPNLMFLISGAPGRTRRSTIQAKDNYVWSESLSRFYEDTLEVVRRNQGSYETVNFCDFENIEKKRFVRDLIIESGTAEGICDHLGEVINNYPTIRCFDFQGSEFGADLQKMSGEGYEVGVSTIISKLYSGEGYSQHLSQKKGKRNRFFPRNLYATMFCGMQDPELYMPTKIIDQGLFRRILLIYVPKNDKYKPLLMNRSGVNDEFESLIEDIVELMKVYNEKSNENYIDCYFNTDSDKFINDLDFSLFTTANKNRSRINDVKQSLAIITAKLSILEVIQDGKNLTGPAFVIKKNHVDKAYEFIQKTTSNWDDVFKHLGRKKIQEEDISEMIQKAIQILKDAGGEIRREEFSKKMGLPASQLDEIFKTLKRYGKMEERIGESTGGRPPRFYKLKE